MWRDRALRNRAVRALLPGALHTVESTLVDVGQLPAVGVNRILVLRANHRLGNAILLTPLITELERVYPGAEIDIVVGGAAAAELLSGFFSVRRIFRLPRYMVRHPIFMISTILQLRRARYDLAIDPTEGSNSGRLLLKWMRPHYAVGVPDLRSASNGSWGSIMLSAPRHMAQLPVFVLRRAFSSEQAAEQPYPALNVCLTTDERRAGRRVLSALLPSGDEAANRIIVGIFANATGSKCYSETWWNRFITAMGLGHPEYAIVEIVAAHGRSQLGARFPAFYSSSPRKMASVMSSLTCFISADCGVMHLGSASGTPTVGLFSTTDSQKYGPYGQYSQAVETEGKTPEEIAEVAIRIIETVVATRPSM
jgi:heptosyltransferase-3